MDRSGRSYRREDVVLQVNRGSLRFVRVPLRERVTTVEVGNPRRPRHTSSLSAVWRILLDVSKAGGFLLHYAPHRAAVAFKATGASGRAAVHATAPATTSTSLADRPEALEDPG